MKLFNAFFLLLVESSGLMNENELLVKERNATTATFSIDPNVGDGSLNINNYADIENKHMPMSPFLFWLTSRPQDTLPQTSLCRLALL